MLNRTRPEGAAEVRTIDDIGLEHINILSGIKNAVTDGDTTYEEAFAIPQEQPAANPLTPGRHDTRRRKPDTQPDAPAAPDDFPPEACAEYRELATAWKADRPGVEAAIADAATRHDECAHLKAFGDIDHTNPTICATVAAAYAFIRDMAKGDS